MFFITEVAGHFGVHRCFESVFHQDVEQAVTTGEVYTISGSLTAMSAAAAINASRAAFGSAVESPLGVGLVIGFTIGSFGSRYLVCAPMTQ